MTTPPHAAAPTRAVLTLLVLVAVGTGLWVAPAAAVVGPRGMGPVEAGAARGDADTVATPARRQESRRRAVQATPAPLLLIAVALAMRRRQRRVQPSGPPLRATRWPTLLGRAPPAFL